MFCPECGSTDSPMVEERCKNCFLKKFLILEIPKNIEVTICAHCNAKFEMGKWEESEIPEEEIIYRALERSIIIDSHIDENKLEIKFEIIQMRGTIAKCHIKSKTNIFGKIIQQSFETEVRLIKNVCITCSKQNSGYYELVIQLRADGRDLSKYELKKIDEIIVKTLNKHFEKDKLAYLGQKLRLKEGNDYYIGSYKSGKKVIAAIQREFGGIIKESPRLIGQDKSTGKGLYRSWISIRLSRFKKGDFVEYSDKNNTKILEILDIDGKRISVKNLANNEKITISWKAYDLLEYLRNQEDVQNTTVISKSPNILQILDPDNYSPIDLYMKPSFLKINIGDELKVIKIENDLYLLSED